MDRREPFRYTFAVANSRTKAATEFGTPTIVSNVYREHVEGYFLYPNMTDKRRQAWHTAATWLRGLEDGETHCLFAESPRLDAQWWKDRVHAVVSRKPGGPRLVLPLEAEVELCTAALRPHLLAWILCLVDAKRLEMGMYPKLLLVKTFQALRHASDVEFQLTIDACRRMYPMCPPHVRRTAFNHGHFPVVLSHWPGLRLCPPFFPDLNTVQPPPSDTRPRHGCYVVIHALALGFAKAVQRDATTGRITHVETQRPHQDDDAPLGVRLSDDNARLVLDTLRQLHGMHPRSFHPLSPSSPYALAAETLTDHCTTMTGKTTTNELIVPIPENAFDRCEVGFAFTYMVPLSPPGEEPRWHKEEAFYEVKAHDQTFSLSSYTGFGMRLRHALLSFEPKHELKAKGVCVVVPDGLPSDMHENIMLTAIGWLRDLALTSVDIVTESTCHAMCLGAMADILDRPRPSTWASIHDGAVASQVLGVAVLDDGRVEDQWRAKYTAQSIKVGLLEQLRDYLLQHHGVRKAMSLVQRNTSCFVGRAMAIDAIKDQIAAVVATLETVFGNDAHTDTTSFALALPETTDPVVVEFSRERYLDWVGCALKRLVGEPWWPELQERLEQCKGVFVSGGLFDDCPYASMAVLKRSLGPNARERTKRNRLHVLHGACLEVYKKLGCQEVVLSTTNDRLRVSKF